ncbi:MAG TPA: hypothetical protein VKI20_08825, partial [Acidimicrobiales bacterium]|nr:hypothetical protein [Acidimicrobiales bacterium]
GAAPQDLVRTFCVIGAPVAQTSTVVAHRVRSVEVSCITPLCVTSELTITEGSGYRFMVGGTRRVTP